MASTSWEGHKRGCNDKWGAWSTPSTATKVDLATTAMNHGRGGLLGEWCHVNVLEGMGGCRTAVAAQGRRPGDEEVV